jgi:sialate O-acetylesterase
MSFIAALSSRPPPSRTTRLRFPSIPSAARSQTFDTQEIKGVVVCGEDKKWFWADAKVTGPDKITVTSKDVPKIIAVRYAWSDNPVCNLINKEALPVTPFRSDDFEMLTKPKQ